MSRKCYRVIVNADDFGITAGANTAICELALAGRLTSTSVMTNMPRWEEIIDLEGSIGVGIHFNLTVGRPVTNPDLVPSLVSDLGEFVGLPLLLRRMRQGEISASEAERELDAQVVRLVQAGIRPDHLNSHESLLKYPFFSKILMRLGKRYGIGAVRTFRPRRFDLRRLLSPWRTLISIYLALQKWRWRREGFAVTDRYDSLLNPDLDLDMAMSKLRDIFGDLPDGVLEIGVHPGYSDGDNSLLGDYVREREVELRALASEEAHVLLNGPGVSLIRFSDITK